MYDTRDNVYSPNYGQFLEFYASWYDDLFGSDLNYSSYNASYSYYTNPADKINVMYNTQLLLTPNAAPSSQATLRRFRAYTPGENSGEYMWLGQIEGIYKILPRWSAAVFTGIATLVDDGNDLGHSENWFPMLGFGGRFVLDESSGLLIRLDFAFW